MLTWLAMIKDVRVPDAGMQDKTIPRAVDARLAEARALFQRDRVGEAETLLRGIASAVPAREDAAMLLAEVLRSRGRLGAAAEAMSVLAEAARFEAGVALRAAAFVRECDRHAIAARICDAALARGAKSPELWVLAGHVARESGDFAAARHRYLSALDLGADPARHHVLGALVNTKRYADPADPDRLRCEAQFRDPGSTPQARASAGFALAKLQNDLETYSDAADTLREANGMARARHPWNAAAWSSFVSTRQRENVAHVPAADPAFMPVFIVGVPRSGTTLTATLLARSIDARDRGELRALRFIAERLRGGGHLGDPAAIGEAGGLYRMLARQDDAPARAYLDQDPLNFRWLDIASAMFPQARVIHMRRDPRDTALSLWSQDFAHPDLAFAYDFGDMAAYMEAHDALMQHWKQCLRIPIHELDYETLVTDTEATLAELRAFIGAPARQPAPSDDTAPVQSASVWQARQPVYRTSVGRWRHYAPYVPELVHFGDGNR